MIKDYDQEIERQHEPAVINEAEPPQYVVEKCACGHLDPDHIIKDTLANGFSTVYTR